MIERSYDSFGLDALLKTVHMKGRRLKKKGSAEYSGEGEPEKLFSIHLSLFFVHIQHSSFMIICACLWSYE
jgi:hypothetical protein